MSTDGGRWGPGLANGLQELGIRQFGARDRPGSAPSAGSSTRAWLPWPRAWPGPSPAWPAASRRRGASVLPSCRAFSLQQPPPGRPSALRRRFAPPPWRQHGSGALPCSVSARSRQRRRLGLDRAQSSQWPRSRPKRWRAPEHLVRRAGQRWRPQRLGEPWLPPGEPHGRPSPPAPSPCGRRPRPLPSPCERPPGPPRARDGPRPWPPRARDEQRPWPPCAGGGPRPWPPCAPAGPAWLAARPRVGRRPACGRSRR